MALEPEAHQPEALLEEQVVWLVLIHAVLAVEQNSNQLVVEAQTQLAPLAEVPEKVEVQVEQVLPVKEVLGEQALEPEVVAVELLALEQMLILLLLFMVVKEALDLRHGPEIVHYVLVVAVVEAKRVVLLMDRDLMQVQAEVAKEEFKDR